jgi:protein-tyrosine phosphatase
MGWSRGDGRDDPNYLAKLSEDWLTINWVDGPARLFDWSAWLWPYAFDLIDEWRGEGRRVDVVCDQGLSRSPTLVMAYLAKRTDLLPDSFVEAATEFGRHYPWKPNCAGITGWVRDHWEVLDRER